MAHKNTRKNTRHRRNGGTSLATVSYRGQRLAHRKRKNLGTASIAGLSAGGALALVAVAAGAYYLWTRDEAAALAPVDVGAVDTVPDAPLTVGKQSVLPGAQKIGKTAPKYKPPTIAASGGGSRPLVVSRAHDGGYAPEHTRLSGFGSPGYGGIVIDAPFIEVASNGFGSANYGNSPASRIPTAAWDIAPPVGAYGGLFGNIFRSKKWNAEHKAKKEAEAAAMAQATGSTASTIDYTASTLAGGSGATFYIGGGLVVAAVLGVLAVVATRKKAPTPAVVAARANRRKARKATHRRAR